MLQDASPVDDWHFEVRASQGSHQRWGYGLTCDDGVNHIQSILLSHESSTAIFALLNLIPCFILMLPSGLHTFSMTSLKSFVEWQQFLWFLHPFVFFGSCICSSCPCRSWNLMRKSPSAPKSWYKSETKNIIKTNTLYNWWLYINQNARIIKSWYISESKYMVVVANLPGIFVTPQVQFMPNQGGEGFGGLWLSQTWDLIEKCWSMFWDLIQNWIMPKKRPNLLDTKLNPATNCCFFSAFLLGFRQLQRGALWMDGRSKPFTDMAGWLTVDFPSVSPGDCYWVGGGEPDVSAETWMFQHLRLEGTAAQIFEAIDVWVFWDVEILGLFYFFPVFHFALLMRHDGSKHVQEKKQKLPWKDITPIVTQPAKKHDIEIHIRIYIYTVYFSCHYHFEFKPH